MSQVKLQNWSGLLEAWLTLTSVKYHGNLYILIPLNQRLALTRLRATGPWSFCMVRKKLCCCWYSVLLYFVIVLGVIAVSTHFYVFFCHFICLMLLFHGHVSYQNFPITGPLQCLQDWKILLSFDFFYVQNDLTFPLLSHFVCFQVSTSYSHLQCLFWEASSIRDDRSTQKTLVIMPYENIIIIIRWLSQHIFIYFFVWGFCVIFLSITGFFRIPMFLVHQMVLGYIKNWTAPVA